MNRVVVTGIGIWSCIGQDVQSVTESLKNGKSGLVFDPAMVEYGLRSGVIGAVPRPDLKSYLPRRTRQMMSEDSEYAYMASRQAFEQAGIGGDYLQQNEVGIIFGNDGNSHQNEYIKIMEQERNPMLVGYNALFRSTTSSVVTNLASIFYLKGINLCVCSSCSSSIHAIGLASSLIQLGQQDMILVGGSCEIRSNNLLKIVNDTLYNDVSYNDKPTLASRPFDENAVGNIPTGGAAALVLEEYEHAVKRGATILAELSGYGFAGAGVIDYHILNWETELLSMKRALDNAQLSISDISLIHARADALPISDQAEATALSHLCGDIPIPITSTDSITGHGSWMAGASRAVYSIIMMNNNFIAPTINLENPIEEARNLNIITKTRYTPINAVLLNSIGVGGSGSALVLRKI